MKINSLEWEEDAKGVDAVRCPVCNTAWRREDDDEFHGCRHVEFIWGDGGLMDQGDVDLAQFEADYLAARAKVNEEDADEDELEDRDRVFNNAPHWDVLEALETKVIDELYELTESGLACGPVSFTTYFGIKTGKNRRPAKHTRQA